MQGTRIGNYTVQSKLGEGGMGEVYRAEDSKLGRSVALKVLPEPFATDPERVARFDREARTLASLHHANIASIFGLEEADGRTFIAMELVEGEDLEERLKRGRIPVDEAIDIARQIADGLEEAHLRGVVHRDLKPANVKITPEGNVKILDFGLARAFQGEAVDEEQLSNSPTITAMTQHGVILGTAAYMSPEQARGRPVDKRSDMWAFGVILYEMLTGSRLFTGETVSDTLASILRQDPDWSRLPERTPESARRLLRRCLQRDARRRLRSAGDAVLELEEQGTEQQAEGPPAKPRPRWLYILPWVIAAAAILALLIPHDAGPPPGTGADGSLSFEVHPPGGTELRFGQISPSGTKLAVTTLDAALGGSIHFRALDDFDWTTLEETQSIGDLNFANFNRRFAFWSPDESHLGFYADRSLRHLHLESGVVKVLHEAGDYPRGASWGENGDILFAPNANSGILRVSATGGTPEVVTVVDTSIADASYRWPHWLPDGEHFLFTLWTNNPQALEEHGGVYVASVSGGEPRKVLDDPSSCFYTEPGYLFVHRAGNLVAVPFDAETRTVSGEAVQVAAGVVYLTTNGHLLASASRTGVVSWVHGRSTELGDRLVWLDRSGAELEDLPFRSAALAAKISLDDRYIALEQFAGAAASVVDIWIGDLSRGTVAPLTRGKEDSYTPAWSPDGRYIAYGNLDTGYEEVFIADVNGTSSPKRVFSDRDLDGRVCAWSYDGSLLFFTAQNKRGGPLSTYVHDVQAGTNERILSHERFDHNAAALSPDGKWLAYVSNESGVDHVYVRPYPALDRKWQISVDRVTYPVYWSKDGSEFVYRAMKDGRVRMMRVAWSPRGDDPDPPLPEVLFEVPENTTWLAPNSDFSRFVASVDEGGRNAVLRVETGWTGEK